MAVGQVEDRTLIVSGGVDGTVRVWDSITGTPVQQFLADPLAAPRLRCGAWSGLGQESFWSGAPMGRSGPGTPRERQGIGSPHELSAHALLVVRDDDSLVAASGQRLTVYRRFDAPEHDHGVDLNTEVNVIAGLGTTVVVGTQIGLICLSLPTWN